MKFTFLRTTAPYIKSELLWVAWHSFIGVKLQPLLEVFSWVRSAYVHLKSHQIRWFGDCNQAPVMQYMSLKLIYKQNVGRNWHKVYCTAMSSGGLFQSSWAHFHGALKNLWHYFTIQTKPFEPCVLSWIFRIRKSSIKVMIKLFEVLAPVHHLN